MRLQSFIEQLVDAGADDSVFDGLILCGGLLIVLIALVGRTILTQLAVAWYLSAFLLYVLYKSVPMSGSHPR